MRTEQGKQNTERELNFREERLAKWKQGTECLDQKQMEMRNKHTHTHTHTHTHRTKQGRQMEQPSQAQKLQTHTLDNRQINSSTCPFDLSLQ